MQPMHLPAGATIFRSGDPSTAVYVIEDGEVAITVNGGIEVARLHAGDLFGESGVLEARPRTATATATTATTVLVTGAETFFHAFGMDNDRALSLVKLLCARLRDVYPEPERRASSAGDHRVFPRAQGGERIRASPPDPRSVHRRPVECAQVAHAGPAVAAQNLEVRGGQTDVAVRGNDAGAVGSGRRGLTAEAVADLERKLAHIHRFHAVFGGQPDTVRQQADRGGAACRRAGFQPAGTGCQGGAPGGIAQAGA